MKNPFDLNRTQLIEELRKRTSKITLDSLLKWSTADLRGEYARVFSSDADKAYTPPVIPKRMRGYEPAGKLWGFDVMVCTTPTRAIPPPSIGFIDWKWGKRWAKPSLIDRVCRELQTKAYRAKYLYGIDMAKPDGSYSVCAEKTADGKFINVSLCSGKNCPKAKKK